MPAESFPQVLFEGNYQRRWLRPDLLAGLTVAAMLVPQAMAYAELGGLPPSAGFRAALVALPVYAFVGTSRHLGVGPEPGTAVMAGLAVAPLAGGDPDRYLSLMATLAGLVGAIALLGGLLRLGFVADLLSKPVLVGYISGVGLTLLSSQLQGFTGVDIEAASFVPRLIEFATKIDQVNLATVLVGLACLATIIVLRKFKPIAPGALIAISSSVAVVAILNIDVSVVGTIDAAVPALSAPAISGSDIQALLPAAIGLVLIGYTDNVLTARAIASQQKYDIDSNRELVALGAINTAAAFGGGFPMSSSASRSIVPATLGARSQLSALISFGTVLVFLLLGRSLLAEIPRPALAAVIIAAAFAVIDIQGFRELFAVNKVEGGLAVVTCLAVISTDLLFGVLVAVALAVIMTLAKVARPHHVILGQGNGLDGWIDVDDHRAQAVPGLMVYRFDAPLFFANAEFYSRRLFELAETNPGEERHIIMDMEGIGSIDTTAADRLTRLLDQLNGAVSMWGWPLVACQVGLVINGVTRKWTGPFFWGVPLF